MDAICSETRLPDTDDTISQVKVLQFHPVQPWLAYADVNQLVTVWDWSNQQVGLLATL